MVLLVVVGSTCGGVVGGCCREYMQGEEVLQPPQVAEILQNLEFEQTRLNAKRLELLQTLRSVDVKTSIISADFYSSW